MVWSPDGEDEGEDLDATVDGATGDAPYSQNPLTPALGTHGAHGAGGGPAREPERTWQQELPRWLATLDSARTRREYEKAVGYFFHTPGVPETLAALTFDLLLAYRGSLALRSERQAHAAARMRAAAPTTASRIGRPSNHALSPDHSDGDGADQADHDFHQDTDTGGEAAPSPLAPATVNIRLTALRQFLAHCSLWGHLPDLPPERIRAALRRLRIERRRPYQILAEPEWAAFLQAAQAPQRVLQTWHDDEPQVLPDEPVAPAMGEPDSAVAADVDVQTATPGGLLDGLRWGVPRAARLRQQANRQELPRSVRRTQTEKVEHDSPTPRRARSGLTGAITAQRDHALLALALATGLRAIELCALDLGDLAREWNAGVEEWWLILPDAKTKGQHGGRTLPLASTLVDTLLAYVGATGRAWTRAADRAMPLFLSHRFAQQSGVERTAKFASGQIPARGRLSPQQVRRIVDRVEMQWQAAQQDGASDEGASADTRAISPHALRHSTAVALLEGNERSGRAPASVEHVRGWLGHFDIRTTQGYLAHLDARRHRRPFTLQPVADPPATTQQDPQPLSRAPEKSGAN